MTLFAALFTMSSCDRETFGYDEGDAKGYLRLALNVDGETVGAKTRSSNFVPTADQFSVAIYKGTETAPTVTDGVDKSIGLSVGNYRVEATYNTSTTEGFDKPYFKGEQTFSIADGEEKTVSVDCKLASAKVNVIYSESFKSYFSDYSTEINSKGNSPITFVSDETRSAYFVPGKLDVYVNVKRPTGSSAKLQGQSIEVEAKHEYNITLNIDASTATLEVTFDDNISEESMDISVSEEALRAQAPTLTAIGFTSGGDAVTVNEGRKATSNIQAYSYAEAGIKSVILTTSSTFLTEQGWPAEVDLCNMTAAEKSALDGLGLSFKNGYNISNQSQGVALVDFTNVPTYLVCNGKDGESSITIRVVDNNSRVCKEDVVLNMLTKSTVFDVEKEVTVANGAQKATINLTFGADPKTYIKVYKKVFGNLTEANYEVTTLGDNKYALTVELGSEISTGETQDLTVAYGTRTMPVTVRCGEAAFALTVSEGDVWTDNATVTMEYVANDGGSLSDFLSGKSLTLQYRSSSEENWSNARSSRSGYQMSLTGLTPGTTYYARVVAKGNDTYTSKTCEFTTEAAPQLPNASFESWNSVKRHSGNWYEYYPWSDSDSSTKGWDTMNQYTFQLNGDYGYTSNSGTISTTDSNSGNAALIRTMGWGPYGVTGNVTNAALSKPCMNKTPGELYLGSFNSSTMAPDYGIEFTSRPKTLSFYYKYTPCNDDNLVVEIIVENRNNGTVTQLGSGSFTSGTATTSYAQKTVTVNYTNTTLKATHLRVLFKSGTIGWTNEKHTGESYWLETPPTTNLSDGKYVASQLYIDDVTLGY
jgi:hypothetical protein